MSESKYEPGTVAMIRVKGDDREVIAFRDDDSTVAGWSLGERRRSAVWVDREQVTDVRPLVVLDPEDARCVVTYLRLAAQYAMNKQAQDNAHRIADQIEQQTRPPKPAEPTGLGAVVEDARGDFWVYTGLRNAKDGETRLWFHGSLPADYADIAAVKVLSEGIQ